MNLSSGNPSISNKLISFIFNLIQFPQSKREKDMIANKDHKIPSFFTKPNVYFALFSLICLFSISVKSSAQCVQPIGIPVSDMILWLCPDSAVFNASNNPASIGEDVHEWHDISGNGWIFENTRNSRRPVLDTNDGNTYLDFNPGDFLSNVPIRDSLNGLNEFSIFIVLKSNITNTDNGVLFYRFPPNGNDEGLCLRYDAAGANTGRPNVIKSGLLGNNGGNQIETTANTQTTNRQTLTIKWSSGGRLYSYIDGLPNDSSNNNVTGPLNSITEILIGKGAKDNGGSRGWNGYIGTIIFYKNQYSSDTIRDISTALPIELLSFDAKVKGDQVNLSWSTASETNNDYFTIEKTIDGKLFEQVAIIDGAGNSQYTLHYSTVDEEPYPGVSYYRLKQTDFNGDFDYSEFVAVEYLEKLEAKIFPNPSNGKLLNLSLSQVPVGQELMLRIYNTMGLEVFSKVVVQKEDTFPIAIELPQKLASGIYYVVGSSQNQSFQQSLIVD
jgi:hypothetical protein